MGMVYKRGQIYWIKYYRNGKPYRESTKSKKEADAKRLLKKREGEISEGKLPGIYFDKVRFDELAEDLLNDYRINGKSTLENVQRVVDLHLEPFFRRYAGNEYNHRLSKGVHCPALRGWGRECNRQPGTGGTETRIQLGKPVYPTQGSPSTPYPHAEGKQHPQGIFRT